MLRWAESALKPCSLHQVSLYGLFELVAPVCQLMCRRFPQATQLEITVGANGRDFYDISLVVRTTLLVYDIVWSVSPRKYFENYFWELINSECSDR